VHEVGAEAASLAGVRVLEATFPRELFSWLYWPMRVLRLVVRVGHGDVRHGGSPRAAITHQVNVRRYGMRKQAALAAHVSQRGRGRSGRLMNLLVRAPAPVFAVLLGREWFAERPAAEVQHP